jgi:hypothetical protein
MLLYNDHAANNSGVFLYAEIMTPLLILFLTPYRRRASAEQRPHDLTA